MFNISVSTIKPIIHHNIYKLNVLLKMKFGDKIETATTQNMWKLWTRKSQQDKTPHQACCDTVMFFMLAKSQTVKKDSWKQAVNILKG